MSDWEKTSTIAEKTPDVETAPPQPSTLRRRADVVVGEARRWYRNLTTENVTNNLKTMAWVAPLTILIWVYAEREQLYTTPDPVSVPISVEAEDSAHRVVTLKTPSDPNILLTLTGARGQVDRVLAALQPQGDKRGLVITLRNSAGLGDVKLDTKSEIANNEIFRKAGVEVVKCQPESLVFNVDTIDEVEVPVIKPDDPTLQTATFAPDRVMMRGPRKLLETTTPQAMAYLGGLTPDQRQPGKPFTATVPIRPPTRDPQISVVPDSVTATLVFSEREAWMEASSVPVWAVAPPLMREHFAIGYEPPVLSRPVRFIGPKDRLDQLKAAYAANQVPIIAQFRVYDSDTGSTTPKTGQLTFFGLPDGVRAIPDPSETSVQYTVTPK
jgi:hypothetical protein